MSWSAYVDNLMQSSPVIKKAAIIGSDDGSIWAKSNDLNATADECRTLASLFNTPDAVTTNGFKFENAKFICPRVEDTVIFGKALSGENGVVAAKSTRAVVIGCFEGDRGSGVVCRSAVEKMADYLRSSGY